MNRKISIAAFSLILLLLTHTAFCAGISEKNNGRDYMPDRALHVDGNKIYNSKDEEVNLRGVNIPSLEWTSKGLNVLNSTYEVFANWNCNVIRLPLSQDRWFGKVSDWSTPYPPDSGAQYRRLVDKVVELASSFGKYVVLDLHWSNAGEWGKNVSQHNMPDENSVQFWVSVAKKYANHPAVLFGLYNEPHDVSWEIWRDGGDITEIENKGKSDEKTFKYFTPGHQKIVDEIRKTGANNILIAGGLDWAYDLRGIAKDPVTGISYALTDTPEGSGIVYDTHIYPWKEWDGKNHDTKVLCIADDYPILVGEFGIEPKGRWGSAERPAWLSGMFDWMDSNNLHWTGWWFYASEGLGIISDWEYTPTAWYGVKIKEKLLSYPDTNAHLDALPKKP